MLQQFAEESVLLTRLHEHVALPEELAPAVPDVEAQTDDEEDADDDRDQEVGQGELPQTATDGLAAVDHEPLALLVDHASNLGADPTSLLFVERGHGPRLLFEELEQPREKGGDHRI